LREVGGSEETTPLTGVAGGGQIGGPKKSLITVKKSRSIGERRDAGGAGLGGGAMGPKGLGGRRGTPGPAEKEPSEFRPPSIGKKIVNRGKGRQG